MKNERFQRNHNITANANVEISGTAGTHAQLAIALDNDINDCTPIKSYQVAMT